MERKILIAGGGIGGLATALACGRQGMATQVFEKKRVLSEVGAGVQLGPNVLRVLEAWGLRSAIDAVACFPQRLEVRSALSGALLGTLPLGARAVQRYGARYATVARVDLHALLHRGRGTLQAQHQPVIELDCASHLLMFRRAVQRLLRNKSEGAITLQGFNGLL